jgi:hypothetical protein
MAGQPTVAAEGLIDSKNFSGELLKSGSTFLKLLTLAIGLQRRT